MSIQDEFQLDDGVISGAFDDTFDMGIVGTSAGSIWYICWTSDRSKTRLVASHTDRITGLIPIEDTHVVTSSLDGTIRIFQLDDRNEILRFDAQGLVNLSWAFLYEIEKIGFNKKILSFRCFRKSLQLVRGITLSFQHRICHRQQLR